MPSAQHNRMSGMTLIALCELTPDAPWSAAKKGPCTVTKGIMDHLREHYGTEYAPNTRETFRRQVLHQFVQGRIADYNPFDPSLPTNSPNAHYCDHGRGFGCRSMLRNRGLGPGRGEIPSRTGCLGGALRE